MEAFYTLQGEGFHQGKAAYFIRLAGCDVGCHWCDVKESWNVADHASFLVEDIVNQAVNFSARLAVITGGEPLMHNLDFLTKSLKEKGFQTNIETSGVYAVSGIWDWICFSPKKFKKPKPEIFKVANELKVIVYNESDFEFAESFVQELNPNCQLFLQTEWSKREKMMPLIIEYVKNNPKWRVSLQTHKYMDIP
ncbi:MAG: 7-carboxy-7-deazaguanine synthase QueE [Bacteroidetes bacterium]|nr:MAG: 7-carboxy-7-deazaguanine synthase QueE [Bacteroidota bacterium]